MRPLYQYACIILLFGIFSCQDDDEITGFTVTESSAGEGAGQQSITINLGRTTSTETKLYFVTGGSAGMDGDYTLLTTSSFYSTATSSSITIPAGESTATLSFNIIDDAQIEPRDETIYFQITGSSDSDLDGSLKNTLFEFQITDNDTAPTSGMQVDLSWYFEESISVNAANFDLYLAKNVVFDENDVVASFEEVPDVASANAKGYENFIIGSDLPNEEYYIIIRYISGSSDTYVNLNFSQGTRFGSASGWISVESIGKDIYYGPIAKSGNSFSFE